MSYPASHFLKDQWKVYGLWRQGKVPPCYLRHLGQVPPFWAHFSIYHMGTISNLVSFKIQCGNSWHNAWCVVTKQWCPFSSLLITTTQEGSFHSFLGISTGRVMTAVNETDTVWVSPECSLHKSSACPSCSSLHLVPNTAPGTQKALKILTC